MIIYGLIGEKLSHSFSPILHDIIFKNSNIRGKYNLFEVEKSGLKDLVEDLRYLKVRGYNVTIPYKVEILKYIDEISDEAANIGAINTLHFKDGKIIGNNTDYYGFGAVLRRAAVDIKGKSALILGTGGASKAVFYYLKNKGIKDIVFMSRNPEKAKTVYPDAEIFSYNDLGGLGNMDIIVNTTPLGMYPYIDKSPVDENTISKFKLAVDLIYNPIQTKFLKLADEMGLKTANGLYMLTSQGIKSQEIWNEMEFKQEFYEKVYDEVRKHVR